MEAEITIRDANYEDAAAIAAIARLLGWWERINTTEPVSMEQEIAQRIAQCRREGTHTVLVAQRYSGEVVGYVAVHYYPHIVRGIDGYVSELFVHPEETGNGVGGRLLDVVQERARAHHCTRLLLMNRRIRDSYRRKFYAKHGWEELPDAAFFTLALPEVS